ncbi:MAG: DUF2431 domain-containing protein [Rhodospirillales bacterium]|nr:DUF2431 domain-containing protein [Alphaproteobacteria bacterium]MCB9986820.1 DUF2431 domain-containing protein [Rhodospirillales bacterium]USO08415.1 MAG: DUF2431 domain-containing protein [Rhodospirillales bacterium]
MFDVIGRTVAAYSRLGLGPWVALGDVLLVGEGNLSFAVALLKRPETGVMSMSATVFESERGQPEDAIRNAGIIRQAGGRVLYDVDATHLDKSLTGQKFDTIIFQFPNVGSRDSKCGHTSNHVMIRLFLRSAASYLEKDGQVLITAVDSPYYDGVFKFDEAALFAGFSVSLPCRFDQGMFPGYAHVNTNDDGSALDNHDRFATWVFKLK